MSRPADITTGCFSSFIKLLPDRLKKFIFNQSGNSRVWIFFIFYQIKVSGNVSYPWFLHIICRKIPKGAAILWDLTLFFGIKQNLFLETSNKQGWLWTVLQEVSYQCTVHFLNSSWSNFWSLSRTRLNRLSKGMEHRRYKTEKQTLICSLYYWRKILTELLLDLWRAGLGRQDPRHGSRLVQDLWHRELVRLRTRQL